MLVDIGLNEEHISKVLQIASYVSPILFYLPRRMQDYTDHGIIHSENLLRLLNDFLNDYGKKRISEEEKYIMCLATYLHDIGCLIKRKNHGESALQILSHPRFSFLEGMLGNDVLACLKYVILYHQKERDLTEVPRDPIIASVRTLLVCAILRLIDECDISARRTSPVLYDIIMAFVPLGSRSQKYWQSHLSISSVVFRNREIIIDSENASKSKLLEKRLYKNLKKINEIFESYKLPTLQLKTIVHSWI